jgi:membrane fusion protein
MQDLFRPEAVAHAGRRLPGHVILAAPPAMGLLGLLLVITVAAAATFASQASFARKATAPGWVVPEGGLVRTRAQETGTLAELRVAEGDRVAAGDPIALVDLSRETPEGDSAATRRAALAREAAAAAEVARHRLAGLDAEADRVRGRIEAMRRDRAALLDGLALLADRVDLARRALDRIEALAANGAATLASIEQARADWTAARQAQVAERQTLADLDRRTAEEEGRLAALPYEIAAAEAESAAASLDQRQADAAGQLARVIRAPVSGRIAALPLRAGGAVEPGATVATLIPEGAGLEAELFAPSHAAGLLAVGQPVRLMLDAFPHERFGTLTGAIVAISPTVLLPGEADAPFAVEAPSFRVRVALAQDHVAAYARAVPLRPGLQLSADIVFDRRSLIEWLLDPLYAVGKRA